MLLVCYEGQLIYGFTNHFWAWGQAPEPSEYEILLIRAPEGECAQAPTDKRHQRVAK